MPEEPKRSRSLFPLYIIIFIIYLFTFLQGQTGGFILKESVSHETDFKVNLTKGMIYRFWIENLNGLDKINITIRKGSSVIYENTFTLDQSEKMSLPYDPDFTVDENGIYEVHVIPLDTGSVNLEIKESVTPGAP